MTFHPFSFPTTPPTACSILHMICSSSTPRCRACKWRSSRPLVRARSVACAAPAFIRTLVSRSASLLASMSLLFTDGVHFRVADSAFQLLHLISALQSLCSKQSPPSSLSIILLSSLALESCALQVKNCGSPPKARFTIPTFHPLRFSNQTSCLSLACCSTWSDAIATPNIRALFIPSIIEHLGSCAPAAELPSLLTSMCAASTPPMQLYPPFSWHELTCFKDSVFKQFGSAFMLNAHWLPLPTDASLPAVAEQVLRIHPNAHIMMKGHFSACSSAAVPLQIRHGRCDQLKPALRDLFSTCQQRCIGIQLFVQALRKFEQRTYTTFQMPFEKLSTDLCEVSFSLGYFTAFFHCLFFTAFFSKPFFHRII